MRFSVKYSIDGSKNLVTKTVTVTEKQEADTKNFANKTVTATKNAAKKTAESTKNITNKAVENTKDFIDELPPAKEITVENLEKEAKIKTLKNERNELKAAYNSRIKDTKAKITAAENSTLLNDVQRQNKVYTLNKQKAELEKERDNAVLNYNSQISEYKKSDK